MERVLVFLYLPKHNMLTRSVLHHKIITAHSCSPIGRCVLVSLHVIACHNGTASVDRVVCFVKVYSELICLHSVKFCAYETSLRAFYVKGNGQGGVDQIIICKKKHDHTTDRTQKD